MSETNLPEQQESILEGNYDDLRLIEMEGYEIGVRRARNVLFVIAGLTAILGIVVFSQAEGNVESIFWILLFGPVLLYVFLGLLTKQKPFVAILVGLIVYVGIWLFNIYLTGFVGVGGIFAIIIRVIIIYYLYQGIVDAKKLEELRKQI
jgi:hypothetical protein